METTKKATQTAAAAFAARHAECQDLMRRLDAKLDAYRREAAEQPNHWGFAGTLDEISRQLAISLASLGDRTAVNAKGIPH